MTKVLIVLATVATILCGLTGCSKPSLYGMRIDAVTVNGVRTLGLSVHGQPITGLVVYFHGSDQKASVIQDDRKHTDFFDPLLRAGYAVVAADAGGNAFGDPASQDDYRRLIAAAQHKYGAKPLFFVAESMGALAALALMREDTDRHVDAMVGISPLMGLPPDVRAVNYVTGPWGGQIPGSADPLTWPLESFADRSFRLYTPTDDKAIPVDASAKAFADRFDSVAAIGVIECPGGHVAAACYEGASVEEWMTALR
jgi:pimeloyl-ACP methyl ester carboxylesterase